MKKSAFITLNILIPLFIGGTLYYFWAPDAIFVEIIDRFTGRETCQSIIVLNNGFLRFLRFYFLDMCWGYALIFSLYAILGNNTAGFNWKIFLLAFVFSASMEILQMTPLVKGTFDVFDILCETFAEGIADFIIRKCL